MDKDSNQPPRIVRFKPAKLKSARRIETPNEQNDGNAESDALIRVMNETLGIRQPEVDTKFSAQIAIGPGPGDSSSSPKTDGSGYKEPWDYEHSNYPTTLPWRKPYSGDPAILDEEEFGEAASKVEYDENTINPAKELGLLLPPMSLLKEAVSTKGKEKEHPKFKTLKEMPGGYMGKMLVYKTGAVKLKLGETLFDVSPGTNTEGDQDLIAIDTKQKTFCILGPVNQKAVVSLDLDSIDLEKFSDFLWMKEKSSLTKRMKKCYS